MLWAVLSIISALVAFIALGVAFLIWKAVRKEIKYHEVQERLREIRKGAL